MPNHIPVIGWLLSTLCSASMAVPLWFVWTWCGIGEKYGAALPEVWRAIPYWHLVGLVFIATTVTNLFGMHETESTYQSIREIIRDFIKWKDAKK